MRNGDQTIRDALKKAQAVLCWDRTAPMRIRRQTAFRHLERPGGYSPKPGQRQSEPA